MRHSKCLRTVLGAVVTVSLATLVVACRVDESVGLTGLEDAMATPPPTRVTSTPIPRPTRTSVPSVVAAPTSPTVSSGVMPSTPTPADVEFTLTILHTGAVRGEIDPCG